MNALLGDTPQLVDYGSALMSNLATKEVKSAVRYLYTNRLDARIELEISNEILLKNCLKFPVCVCVWRNFVIFRDRDYFYILIF